MPDPRLIFRTLAAALLIFLSSCSSDRIWRISPLENDASRDRVNLWPIAYHDRGATSVLWPIFDVDSMGFAVRPLLAKDGSKWSSLWPIASWDTSAGTGWVFPFYNFDDNAGLFPIANIGRFSYFGPAWWRKDSSGNVQSSGLFPLAYFGKSFNYVGPLWWSSNTESHYDAGLFPVAMFGSFNYAGPVWWTEGGDAHGLFPLYAVGPWNHFGPVWWGRAKDGTRSRGIFPLLWSGRGGKDFGFLPFYSHTLDNESQRRNYLLGLGHSYTSNERQRKWALPFYYQDTTNAGSDTVLFPFFWKHQRGDSARVQTLFGSRRVSANDSSFNLYPFWWSSKDEDSSWKMLAPLFYYSQDGDDRTLLTPLGGRGWTRSGEARFTNFLGPLYHHSASADGLKERTAFLWPLIERQRDGDETTTRVWPLARRTTSPEGAEGSYALGLGHTQTTADTSSARLWPLFSSSNADQVPDLLYDLTLFGQHSYAGKKRRRAFPFFSATTTEDSVDASYLTFLGDYRRRPNGKAWRLWPFVSSTDGIPPPDPLYWLTLVGGSKTPETDFFHFGTPLIYSQTKRRDTYSESSSRRFLTLFSHEKKRNTGLLLPSSTERGPANLVSQVSSGFLFDALLSKKEWFRKWNEGVLTASEKTVLHSFSDRYADSEWVERDSAAAAEILKSHGFAVDPADSNALRTALHSFADENTSVAEHTKRRLPFIYGYERSGDEVEWNGPLWLVHSKSKPEHKKFSLLYYLYRSETKGEEKTRDIFPFITWDSAPQKTRFSFLWRLINYQRDGDKRGGHVLFIPWGNT